MAVVVQQYGPFLCDIALLELVVQLLQFGLQLGVGRSHGVVGGGGVARGGRQGR